jgi:hypothetical protein
MSEPVKVDRKLPPHELNARRNRKRIITKLPAIASLPEVHQDAHTHSRHHQAKPSADSNLTVYNHAIDSFTNSRP